MSFRDQPVHRFLDELAAKQPTPGGGAVAGLCGALATALAQMVVSYSLGKKTLAPHEPLLRDSAARLDRLRSIFLQLSDEDAQAYALVNELARLPADNARRSRELPEATQRAIQIPLAVGAAAVDALRLMRSLCGASNAQLRSDLAIAAVLAEATARAAKWNVTINLVSPVTGIDSDALRSQATHYATEAGRLCEEIERRCA